MYFNQSYQNKKGRKVINTDKFKVKEALKYKILVTNGSKQLEDTTKNIFSNRFEIIPVKNYSQILNKLNKIIAVDAIVIDLVNKKEEFLKIAYKIKTSFNTYHIPIIIISKNKNLSDIKLAYKIGANSFIQTPINKDEFEATILMTLQQVKTNQNANPLTNLPGNNIINLTITNRLNKPLAVLYADLNNFKAYNDKYGFCKGDQVIKLVAKILTATIEKHGNNKDFVGHIGGDDFIVLSTPRKAKVLKSLIVEKFNKSIIKYYNKADLKLKKIAAFDRLGNLVNYPIMSISIATVTNENIKLKTLQQVAQIAARLKRESKKIWKAYLLFLHTNI